MRYYFHMKTTSKGFTLIEVIVSIVLLGIIMAVAGMGMVKVVEGYIFAKKNAETVQKGQMAITRLEREFNFISSVTSGSATSINYTHYKTGAPVSHIVSLAGDTLTLDGDILTDSVSAFSLKYRDTYNGGETAAPTCKIIEVSLTLSGAGGTATALTTRVVPRNL